MEKIVKYWELFVKQKSGRIGKQELEELQGWIRQDPEGKLLISEFEEIHAGSAHEDWPEFDPAQKWDEMQTLIKIDSIEKQANSRGLYPRMARIAAALLLLAGVTFIFYQYSRHSTDQLSFQQIARSGDSIGTTINLPDGSFISLNRNTELLYPETFSADNRTVYLRGEAFFEIAHDAERPFIVHSGITKTTVLGTSFNLRAYGREDEVKLTVVAGKVAFTLADEKEGVIVTPGDMAWLSPTKSIKYGPNSDPNFMAWKTRRLMFDDSPFDLLCSSMEKYYNISLKVDNPHVLSCRFTGDFRDMDAENALKIITKATGTSYERVGTTYLIYGNGCE